MVGALPAATTVAGSDRAKRAGRPVGRHMGENAEERGIIPSLLLRSGALRSRASTAPWSAPLRGAWRCEAPPRATQEPVSAVTAQRRDDLDQDQDDDDDLE